MPSENPPQSSHPPSTKQKTCSGASAFCGITSSWRFPWPRRRRSVRCL
jgi:hypothetical protein